MPDSDIAHLDFMPEERIPSLRERALAAFQSDLSGHRAELLRLASERAQEVLGEPVEDATEIKLQNVRDGDGEVFFVLDGLDFKVKVTYPANVDEGAAPHSVGLSVRAHAGPPTAPGNSWLSVESLASLGAMIDQGKFG